MSGVVGRGWVDTHHHVWDLAVRDQEWIDPVTMSAIRHDFDLEELRPRAAAAGVDRTVVVQTVPVGEETPELLALAADSELVAAVVGWTDLTAPDTADRLAALRDHRGGRYLAGIRHQVQDEPDPRWLARRDVRHGLRAVGEAGLVYELLVVPDQLDAALDVVRTLPEVTFVLDHAGKPAIASGELGGWASRIWALAEQPNVYCKLSGLVTEAGWRSWTTGKIRPYADTVLDAFGPDRVMFGSDWPVCLLACDYSDVVELAVRLTGRLDGGERARMFARTAERVYQLGVTG